MVEATEVVTVVDTCNMAMEWVMVDMDMDMAMGIHPMEVRKSSKIVDPFSSVSVKSVSSQQVILAATASATAGIQAAGSQRIHMLTVHSSLLAVIIMVDEQYSSRKYTGYMPVDGTKRSHQLLYNRSLSTWWSA